MIGVQTKTCIAARFTNVAIQQTYVHVSHVTKRMNAKQRHWWRNPSHNNVSVQETHKQHQSTVDPHWGKMWMTPVMWLPLVVPLIVELANATTKLQKIEHGNLFKDIGHVYSQTKDAHLIIPINIQELEDRKNALENIRTAVINMDENKRRPSHHERGEYLFNSKTRKSLNWMKRWTNESITNGLDRIEDSLKSFSKNVSMIGDQGRRRRGVVYHNMIKRQIVVGTIGAVAGAFIAGLVNKYQTDKLVHIMKQQQDVIVHQLEQDQVKIHQNAADLIRLNNTVGAVVNAVWRLENLANNTNYVTMSLMTTYSVTETVHKSNAIMDALEDARSGQFNINLCETTGLKAGITELQKQGLKHGRSLGIRSLFDLTHLDVSYLVDFAQNIIYLIVHAPLIITNDFMVLYQYKGSPVLLTKDSNIYVEVEVENHYLALTPDNSLYNEWTDASLKECQHLQHNYFCPGNVQYKRERKSCLTGLYDGNNKVVREQCPLVMTKHVSTVTQLNESTYMITETSPSELVVDCSAGPKQRYPIQGTYLLDLDPGCVASTRQMVITRPQLESEVTIHTKFLNNPLDLTGLVDDESSHHFLELAHTFLGTVGKHIPVQAVTSLAKFRTELEKANHYTLTEWITSLRPGSLLHNIIIFVVLIIIAYILGRTCPYMVRTLRKKRHQSRGREMFEYPPKVKNILAESLPNQEAGQSIMMRLNSVRYRSTPATPLDDARRLLATPPPVGNWPDKLQEAGVSRNSFKDISDFLHQRRRDQAKSKTNQDPEPDQLLYGNPSESQEMDETIAKLYDMIREADFECSCLYPFQSLIENVPIDPELGIQNPEEADQFVKKVRQIRAEYLNKLTTDEKLDLIRKEGEKKVDYATSNLFEDLGTHRWAKPTAKKSKNKPINSKTNQPASQYNQSAGPTPNENVELDNQGFPRLHCN